MSNVLADDKHHQIVTLGRLGWSLRSIERTTGVRRETISGYLKAVGIVVPGRGRRASRAKPAISSAAVSTDSGGANPAISEGVSPDAGEAKAATRAEVSTDSVPPRRPGRAPSASACEPYRELITEALGRGRNAMAIWQDLVDDHGLVDVGGALRNGGVRPGDSSGSARPRFEALPQPDFEIGEAAVRTLAVTQIRLELGVRLEPKRGAEQPATRLLNSQSGADDLRRLLARSREYFRKRHRAAWGLGAYNALMYTDRRAQRDGTTSDAHETSSRPT